MAREGSAQGMAIALGTLAVTLTARTKRFRDNMGKAIAALKQFNAEAAKQKVLFAEIAKSVRASSQSMTQALRTGAKRTGKAVSSMQNQVEGSARRMQSSSRQVRSEVQQTADTVERTGKRIVSRGKEQLGAIISFQEGVGKFIRLNLRWFVVWRSFWFLWTNLQEALANINILMHETSLALRTGAEALGNEVELLVKRNALTREAIRFTAQHLKTLQEYIKSFYYLTTAGLSWSTASQTISTAMKTSIALDEDAIQTTRTLTSLYNVFGPTLTRARTPVEKMQKISAILTATFRQQDIEMADYNKAMTYVGALSKTAGVSLEVLVASLGVLGTHFVKGTKGGTALARAFARLLRYPERLARVTGYAFDPTKPLQFEQAIRLIGRELRSAALSSDEFGVSTRKAAEMIDLLGLRGIRVITLAENFEKLADQIKTNREATFDLVESMVALVESDPSAQLRILGNAVSMNITAMVRGALQIQTFSNQLLSLNKVLLRAIDLSEDLGRAVGMLLGSLERIPAALIAWRLASTKAKAPTTALGKWIRSVGYSLALMWKALFRTKKGTVGFGTALGFLLKKFTALSPTIRGAATSLGRLAGWFAVITGAIDALGVIWDAVTGKFTKKSKQFAFEEVAIQKGMLSKLLSYLNLRNLAYRIANRRLMKLWERAREFHSEKLNQQGLSEVEYAQKMEEFKIRWWSIALGIEEAQLKKRMGLITDADEELMAERVRIESETQREIQKLRLSGLENQLYVLDQRIQVMKAKGIEASLIETYFALKRTAIFSKFLKDLEDKFRRTYDVLWKVARTSLDQQLLDARKAGIELEKLHAQQFLTRIRMQFEAGSAEAEVISDSMKELEDETLRGTEALYLARIRATKKGLTELSDALNEALTKEKGIRISRAAAELLIEKKALEDLKKVIDEQTDFRHGRLIAGGRKDLLVLKENYEKRREVVAEATDKITESVEKSEDLREAASIAHEIGLIEIARQYMAERSAIVKYWAEKRRTELEKINERDYIRTSETWTRLTERLNKIYETHLKIIAEQRERATEREIADETERKKVLADLDKKEKEAERNRDAALYRLRYTQTSEYLKYLIMLRRRRVKESREGDREIAESNSNLWLTLLAGMTEASEDYAKRVGRLSDFVKRTFDRLYQDLEGMLASSLSRWIGLEEEYGRESLELIAERNEEQRRALRDQLEEGRISRTRYYAELDELDRKFTEEVENRRRGFVKNMGDLWKSLQRTALAEFSKLVVGIIAESLKALAVEKGITKAVVAGETSKGIARLWSWFTKLGPIGMAVGIAAVAAFVAKMTGLIKFAKGGIIEKRTAAVIGEEGPEAVIPLTRRDGRLALSERGREILQPLLGLEQAIPSFLRSAVLTEGLIRLNPEATAALGARTTSMRTEQKVEINVTFQGDTIDFSGSVPMINDLTTIDKVYEDVWLPAKQRRIERLKETIAEVIE